MDKLFLEAIEVHAHGGVSEAEREIGQRYRLDLVLELDLARAGASDSLADTVSYARAYEIAVEAMGSRPFSLIEFQAERIAQAILRETRAEAVTVRLHKLLPPMPGVVAATGAEIRRARRR
jgi:dihydroneopterin aldolase